MFTISELILRGVLGPNDQIYGQIVALCGEVWNHMDRTKCKKTNFKKCVGCYFMVFSLYLTHLNFIKSHIFKDGGTFGGTLVSVEPSIRMYSAYELTIWLIKKNESVYLNQT